ncbi:MAG: hypothetical protein Q7K39_00700 [Candidatus Magasanikbacteria bacterium]|nr:hypothetical protein [Candidatus Magasanikbacteria bacterium]
MSTKKLLVLALPALCSAIFLIGGTAQAETVSSSVAGFSLKAGTSDPVIRNITITNPPVSVSGTISGTIIVGNVFGFRSPSYTATAPAIISATATTRGSSATTADISIGVIAPVGSSVAGSNVIIINPATIPATSATAPNHQPAPVVLLAPARQDTLAEVAKPQSSAVSSALVVEPTAAEQAEIAAWFEDKKPVEKKIIKKTIKKTVATKKIIAAKKVVKKKTVKIIKQSVVKVKKNSAPAR